MARARPETLGRPFTRRSIRKLADYLTMHAAHLIEIGRERLRQILHRHGITFQRTKTWKESTDPDRDAKLARIEYLTGHFPQRVFAFDEFGPLAIRPQVRGGCGAWVWPLVLVAAAGLRPPPSPPSPSAARSNPRPTRPGKEPPR